MPSSDIAAGFVLLSKYQAAQREWILKHDKGRLGIEQYLSNIPVREDTKFLDISTAEDSHLVNDLIYYMNYSLAIFGWPLQMVDDPCMLCCIYPYLRLSPCSGRGKKKNKNKDDNKNKNKNKDDNKNKKEKEKEKKTKSDQASSKKRGKDASGKKDKNKAEKDEERDDAVPAASHTSTDDAERVEAAGSAQVGGGSDQLNVGDDKRESIPGQLNEDCDVPIILEDNCCSCNAASAERRLAQHNYEIIYISYKSTVSVVPFLVAADHSKRTIVVAIRGSMNLSDMVTDMNGTVDKLPIENCPDDWLCHRGITRAASYVKSALIQEHILDRAFNCRPDLGSTEYQLMLCGHSLGAGAAAILGIMLRPQYPNLKAYLYSPPGGILSMPAVEYTKQFAYGIILGNDTVARLGIAQLERLRYHILLSLDSTKKSSSRILARALCPSMCFGNNDVDYDPEHSLDLLHGVGGRSFDHNGTKIPFQSQPQVLYVPGRLIHVVKNHSFKTKTRRLWNQPIYQAVWTENKTYDRILISEGMFFDHLPHNLMHSMKMLFLNTLPGRRESKQSTSSAPSPVPVTPIDGIPVATATRQEVEPAARRIGFIEPTEAESIEHEELARKKLVIENDNNNNNNNNELAEDNNNQGAKVYPNLNRNPDTQSDISRSLAVNESQTSLATSGRSISNKETGPYLDENGNERAEEIVDATRK